MKKQFRFVVPILLFVLASCQQETSDLEQPGSGGAGSDTYLPLTANTQWKFKDSLTSDQTTLQVLNTTKVFDGRQYTAVLGSNSQQTDTFYMAHQGADYFNYAEVDNGTSSGRFLFHFLNDTAAVGRSWEYVAGQGNGFTAYFKTTILERGISRTVGTHNFNDVIHTRMELSYDIMGERMSFGFYDYYVAKGIGIVQVKSRLGGFGAYMSTSSDIIEYQIK